MNQPDIRPRVALAAGLVGLLVTAVAAPASAYQGWRPPASIGPGVGPGVGPAVGGVPSRPASVEDALRCAHPAHYVHFKRHRAVIAVAVGMGESYCTANARHRNPPTQGCPNGSVDRGLWQLNSCYHPEVNRRCAYKANCNARATKHISDHGKDWTPWSVYNSGTYRQYLDIAKEAVARVYG